MEEKNYFDMYKEELKDITPCSSEEQKNLVEQLLSGEETATIRLVEGNLYRIIKIAEQYIDKGVLVEDLVAEGNLALTLAVDYYIVGNFDEFIEEAIHNAMKEFVAEQESYKETGSNLAVLLNVLDEVSKRLAQEYGREATVTEIAEKMKMSEDQIKELMKMALDAISASAPEESEEEMYVEQDGAPVTINSNYDMSREVDLEKEFDFETDDNLDI